MINVSLGTNKVYVTLRERVELPTPIFLIGLKAQGNSKDEIILKSDDTNPATKRVNELNIEVVATSGAEDLANGKVFLRGGNYNYRIFESDNPALDITDKKLLEQGILRFDTESNTEVDYTKTDTDFTYER